MSNILTLRHFSVYCKSISLYNNLFLHSRCWDFLIWRLIPGTFKCVANHISDQIKQETWEAQTTIMLTHGLQSPDCTLDNIFTANLDLLFNTSVILSLINLYHEKLAFKICFYQYLVSLRFKSTTNASKSLWIHYPFLYYFQFVRNVFVTTVIRKIIVKKINGKPNLVKKITEFEKE